MSDDDDSDPKLKALFQQVKSKPVSTEELSLECTQLLARLRQIPEAVRSEQTVAGLEDFSALPFQQIGQYELLERIAGGGMGEVFKARQQKLGNVVAIKLLYRDRVTDRQLLDRFEQEMRAVGRLNHENIVKPLYADEQNGVPYLVMEYVEGKTLADLLEEYTAAGKSFPIELACESIRQAAIGLGHAHQHGIIHRDIKPSNLMLANVSGSSSVVSGQTHNKQRTTNNGPTDQHSKSSTLVWPVYANRLPLTIDLPTIVSHTKVKSWERPPICRQNRLPGKSINLDRQVTCIPLERRCPNYSVALQFPVRNANMLLSQLIKSLKLPTFSNCPRAARRKGLRAANSAAEVLEIRQVPSAVSLGRPAISSSIDLRLGQDGGSNSSPVAVSSALENSEAITVFLGSGSGYSLKLQSESSAFAHQIGRKEGTGWWTAPRFACAQRSAYCDA